jgi:hypothetical protein
MQYDLNYIDIISVISRLVGPEKKALLEIFKLLVMQRGEEPFHSLIHSRRRKSYNVIFHNLFSSQNIKNDEKTHAWGRSEIRIKFLIHITKGRKRCLGRPRTGSADIRMHF